MKRLTLVVAGFVVLALAGSVVAQQQQQQPTATGIKNAYDPNKTNTITGCLKPGEKPGMFVVADATEAKAGAESGSVGTSGAANKMTYALRGVIPPGVDLGKHVNHKVEVAGTISISGEQAAVNMHTFKHVAASCE